MKKSIISTVITLFLLVPAIFVVFITIHEMKNEVLLNLFGEPTTANILDIRNRINSSSETLYEVAYSFEIDNKSYFYNNGPESENSHWVALSKGNWENVRESKQLEILYLPENPTISNPLFSNNSTFFEAAITLAIALTISIMCGLHINHLLKTIASQKSSDE